MFSFDISCALFCRPWVLGVLIRGWACIGCHSQVSLETPYSKPLLEIQDIPLHAKGPEKSCSQSLVLTFFQVRHLIPSTLINTVLLHCLNTHLSQNSHSCVSLSVKRNGTLAWKGWQRVRWKRPWEGPWGGLTGAACPWHLESRGTSALCLRQRPTLAPAQKPQGRPTLCMCCADGPGAGRFFWSPQ